MDDRGGRRRNDAARLPGSVVLRGFREAFGQPIGAFPAIQRTLADMGATSVGALHLVFALTGLEDRIDAGDASDDDVLFHRFLVNLTKYLVSNQTTAVVHSAVEVLGGNGAIEEFSVLPRLYRDAMVYESWEGSHNVLVAQVLNDLRRLPVLEVVAQCLHHHLDGAHDHDLAASVAKGLDEAFEGSRRSMADATFGMWRFRSILDRIGLLAETVLLIGAGEEHLARHLFLGAGDSADPGRTADVAELSGRVGAVLAAMD